MPHFRQWMKKAVAILIHCSFPPVFLGKRCVMKKHLALLFLFGSLPFVASAGSFTENHTVVCGETLRLGAVGYPTWNEAQIIQAPANGVAGIVQGSTAADSLIYHAAPNYMGIDTLIVLCAHATQITCDTGIYIIETTCANAGFEPASPAALQVFPNPASTELFIQTTQPFTAAKLYTASGQKSMEKRWAQGTNRAELPIGHLPNGVYWLEISQLQRTVMRIVLVGD